MLQSHTTPAMSGTISLYRFFVILTVAAHSICCGATDNEKDVYIVYMGSLPEDQYSPMSHHLSVLQEVLEERYNCSLNFYLISIFYCTNTVILHLSFQLISIHFCICKIILLIVSHSVHLTSIILLALE